MEKHSPITVDPDPASVDGVYLFIPNEWLAVVLGQLADIASRYYWDAEPDSNEVYQAVNAANKILSTLYEQQEVISLLEDVRLNADGTLQKKINANWEAAGAVTVIESATAHSIPNNQDATAEIQNGVLDIGVPIGASGADGANGTIISDVDILMIAPNEPPTGQIVGQTLELNIPYPEMAGGGVNSPNQALYALPETTTDDRLCAAAWALARQWSDMTSDVLEIQGFLTFGLFDIGEVLAVIPTIPVFNSGYELVFQDLPQLVFNTVLNNIQDDDAVALVARKLYCALQQCYPNVDQIWDYVEVPITFPTFDTFFDDITNVFTWQNAKAWWEVVANSLDGASAGFITLHFARMVADGFAAFGVSEPTEKIVGLAYNNASEGNSLDCLLFDCGEENPYEWSHVFDFTSVLETEFVTIQVGEWIEGQYIENDVVVLGGDQNAISLNVLLEFAASDVRKVVAHMVLGDCSGNENFGGAGTNLRTIVNFDLVPLEGGLSNGIGNKDAGEFDMSWEGGQTIDDLVFTFYGGFEYAPNQPSGFARIVSITIWGNGTNPFV